MDTISHFLHFNDQDPSFNRKESRKAVRNMHENIFQLSNAQ